MLLKGFEKKEKKKKTTTHCVRNVLSGRDSTSLLCKSGDLFRSDTFSSTLKQENRRSTTTTAPQPLSPRLLCSTCLCWRSFAFNPGQFVYPALLPRTANTCGTLKTSWPDQSIARVQIQRWFFGGSAVQVQRSAVSCCLGGLIIFVN